MKRKKITRTVEVMEIRGIIEDLDRHRSTRTVDIPGKFKKPLDAIKVLRSKLVYGCVLIEVIYTRRKFIKCTMPLDDFYSYSSHEELD